MNNPDESLRDRLLRQHVPEPTKLTLYRKETLAMIEQQERRLRFQTRFTGVMWLILVAMGVMYAMVAGWSGDQPTKVYFSIGLTLMMLMIGGAVQLVAGFIGRARLEVSKDIKGLELRVLEFESILRNQSRS